MWMLMKTHPRGVLIEARVRPNSPRFSLLRKGGELVIEVTSPPQEGKANTEIVKALRKLTGHDVEIVKGHKGRRKLILIVGSTQEEIRKLLEPR
jgi:uncharacterized protein (TIGR00251 family)